MNIANDLSTILADYEGITLEEIQRASLLRRKDRKYLFSIQSLPDILKEVSSHYRILEINGQRSQFYRTFYYDTPGLEMYHKHHRGLANRHKVRFREYTSTEEFYLEVKNKNAKGITSKKRVQTLEMDPPALVKESGFLEAFTPYKPEGINFTLENSFRRITLVNGSQSERITLDYQLHFSANGGGRVMDFPGISVAEIKFEKHLARSPLHAALRRSRIKARRFSKYAIGMALVHSELKQNRFKERVRFVHKINHAYIQQIKNLQHV